MFPPDLMILIISSISVVDSLNCFPDDNDISVCSDDSTTGSIVYLSGVRDDDDTTRCSCSLSAETPTNITITTSHQGQHGCQYKLQFLHMNGSWVYSCTQTSMISISTDGSIQINLLSDIFENNSGFAVCLEIKSASDSPLTFSCGKSRWSPTTTSSNHVVQTSDTESITPPGDGSNQLTSGNESNQPTSNRESNQPTTFGSESGQQTTPTGKNDNSMSGIIGGSVGGLVVIIVTVTTVICVIHKRRKDKTRESQEATETDAHPYQNIPDNRSGEIIHPYQNIPDNRSGEITHQPKQNNELVLRENDPYTRIDNDIIKPSNGNQDMEYLENDLYISSDDVIDDVVIDNKLKAQLPVGTEYAQVNKSNANKTTNGNCKTGPKGDNYAVVNKGGKMINNDKQFKIGPSGDQYTVVNKVGEGSTNN